MGLVVLLFFSEILREVAEDRCGIRRPAFKGRDATRPAPAIATFYTDDDVLVEKSAFFQKPDCGFWSEFIGPEFAHADQIAKPVCLIRFCQLQEGIQPMDFAYRGRLTVLRQRLDLRFHEFAESTIFKAFDYRSCSQVRHRAAFYGVADQADMSDPLRVQSPTFVQDLQDR